MGRRRTAFRRIIWTAASCSTEERSRDEIGDSHGSRIEPAAQGPEHEIPVGHEPMGPPSFTTTVEPNPSCFMRALNSLVAADRRRGRLARGAAPRLATDAPARAGPE